jgi:hypothetical protein
MALSSKPTAAMMDRRRAFVIDRRVNAGMPKTPALWDRRGFS